MGRHLLAAERTGQAVVEPASTPQAAPLYLRVLLVSALAGVPSRRTKARRQEGERPSPHRDDSRADSGTWADLIAEDCAADGRRPAQAPRKTASLRTACGPLACRDLTA
jgi:hypothetical protein